MKWHLIVHRHIADAFSIYLRTIYPWLHFGKTLFFEGTRKWGTRVKLKSILMSSIIGKLPCKIERISHVWMFFLTFFWGKECVVLCCCYFHHRHYTKYGVVRMHMWHTYYKIHTIRVYIYIYINLIRILAGSMRIIFD